MIALDHILEVCMTSSDATIYRRDHYAVTSERISQTSCFYSQNQKVLRSRPMDLLDHDGFCLSGRFTCSCDLTSHWSSRLHQSRLQTRMSCGAHH
ncbi:MAG TPA: hypothetical protein VGN34_03580 [Ktedonobacteraceae bacterium]